MNNSMKTGGRVMGLVGSIVSLVAFLIMYIIFSGDAAVSSFAFITAVCVLILGVIGGILGIIGTCYARTEKTFPIIMSWVAAVMLLGASILTTMYLGKTSDGRTSDALAALPFTFIPDFLVFVGVILNTIAKKDTQDSDK